MSTPGIPDPKNPKRVLNPYNLNENPTFLPGDKVRDKRDGKIWRVINRGVHYENEILTLREVGNDQNEKTFLGSEILMHLEMVAMFI